MPLKRVEMHFLKCYTYFMRRRYYKRRYNRKFISNSDLSFIIRACFYVVCLPFLLLAVLGKLILKIKNKPQNYAVDQSDFINDDKLANISNNEYSSKSLVTNYENYFLSIIDENFSDDYRIVPQVPLSSIVNKNKRFPNQFQSELYRTIDIGIFNKKTFEPLLMIEINDKTHNQADRHQRDLKVREILKIADIPLLTFYSNMPNDENYIIDSIEDYLN